MPNDLFESFARWLELESAAERQRLHERQQRVGTAHVESTGETLIDLVIDDHQIAVGGMYLLDLCKRNRSCALPWNRLRVGSPVILTATDDQDYSQHGVVSRRSQTSIQVAVDEWPDGDQFRLDRSPDERTRRQQLLALRVVEHSRGRLGELRKTFFGERNPRFGAPVPCDFTLALNSSQQDAVQFALSAEDIAIIHGPPGTGKTTTLIELIGQLIKRDEKVLACAPSNTAVDNLLERLAEQGHRVVRLGHPARVAESLRSHSLDAMVQNHPDMKIVQNLLNEADGLFHKAAKHTRARPARGARNQIRQAARQLKSDARRLEQQVVSHVLDRADVVCSTTSLDDELLGDRSFPWLVIDEACQTTEPGCWVPIQRADRIVLAGDHCQLPPTVISKQAAQEGFNRSLMQRTLEIYDDAVHRRLDVQYRMHHQIMSFSSKHFYHDSLTAHESVYAHCISDLRDVQADQNLDRPVLFIDTAGAGYEEQVEPDGESRLNPDEGQVVMDRVRELIDAGLYPEEIAVIAPYAAQVRWLRQRSEWNGLEIDTVDGFQGREKEAVVISLVRSNTNGEIGFLSDTRRMNVALTRARRKLIVIGDSSTLANHAFYVDLLEHMESIESYVSVFGL